MKVIALVDLPNRRKAGDVFDAPDDQARLLILLKHASEVADPHETGGRVGFIAKDLEADPASDAAPPAEPGTRRRYRRRDLTAESSED